MRKRQHLIALDLDGTLLTDKKKISPYTKKIIQQAILSGHIVVIATGRPYRASVMYYHELGLTTPMVNFNGALIHHPTESKWDALHNPLPHETAHKIIQTCYEFEVDNIFAEIRDNIYLDKFNEKVLNFFTDPNDKELITIGSLKNHLHDDPTSLLIHPKEGKLKELRQYLDDAHANVIEHRRWGVPWDMIEVVKKGVHKAIGLQKIAHYFHISPQHIIAFGDEDNDLEMIEYAGVGVAMGNAISHLKQIANYETLSNQEDGIGKFLASYLQLEHSPIISKDLSE